LQFRNILSLFSDFLAFLCHRTFCVFFKFIAELKYSITKVLTFDNFSQLSVLAKVIKMQNLRSKRKQLAIWPQPSDSRKVNDNNLPQTANNIH